MQNSKYLFGTSARKPNAPPAAFSLCFWDLRVGALKSFRLVALDKPNGYRGPGTPGAGGEPPHGGASGGLCAGLHELPGSRPAPPAPPRCFFFGPENRPLTFSGGFPAFEVVTLGGVELLQSKRRGIRRPEAPFLQSKWLQGLSIF